MEVGVLTGGVSAVVLFVAVSGVSPHQRHFGWYLQQVFLHEARAFLPQVGHELRLRVLRADDLHLVGDGVADAFSEKLIVVAHAGVERGIARVGQAAQSHAPQDLFIRFVARNGIRPGTLKDLWMSGEVVRNVFGPPRYVDAQWNRMMLV